MENLQTEWQYEKIIKRRHDLFRGFWDNIKQNTGLIIVIPEGEDREKGPKSYLNNVWKFP